LLRIEALRESEADAETKEVLRSGKRKKEYWGYNLSLNYQKFKQYRNQKGHKDEK